jgi:formylglycine-generating enzyme required for sulfatase activity
MATFELDAPFPFYGRERETQDVLQRLRLHPFIAIVGASGSGKSSLAFAGIVPGLKKDQSQEQVDWIVASLRPGCTPLANLRTLLADECRDPEKAVKGLLEVAGQGERPEAKRLLLIVDQFEEIFTVAKEDEDIAEFQELLRSLSGVPACYVVLTARADFYPDLMNLTKTPIWPEIKAHRLELERLDSKAMRAAIVRPAEDAGVYLQQTLVERLLSDAGDQPGILPFLQETLVRLWHKRRHRYLSLSAYEGMAETASNEDQRFRSGLEVAMAKRADYALDTFRGSRSLARRVFIRLVQFGEHLARRQQTVLDLRAAREKPEDLEELLEHFTQRDTRLLTLTSADDNEQRRTVDIAHEALLTGWPTLKEWIKNHEGTEAIRRRLEAKAAERRRLNRRGGLLDAGGLRDAEQWLASTDGRELGCSDDLNELMAASRRVRRAARAIALLLLCLGGVFWYTSGRDKANKSLVDLQSVGEGRLFDVINESQTQFRWLLGRLEADAASESIEPQRRTRAIIALAANDPSPQRMKHVWTVFRNPEDRNKRFRAVLNIAKYDFQSDQLTDEEIDFFVDELFALDDIPAESLLNVKVRLERTLKRIRESDRENAARRQDAERVLAALEGIDARSKSHDQSGEQFQSDAAYWAVFRDQTERRQRFLAGLAIGQYDSRPGELMEGEVKFLANELLDSATEDQEDFRDYLRGIRERLVVPIEREFHAPTSVERGERAALALLDFADKDVNRIVELVSDANASQFNEVLFPAVKQMDHATVIDRLNAVIKNKSNSLKAVRRGKRRAGAIITLLRLGSPSWEQVFAGLRIHDDPKSLSDPEAVTQFIHGCKARQVKPSTLIDAVGHACRIRPTKERAARRREDPVLYGLLLALGEFDYDQLDIPAAQKKAFIDRLGELFQEDPSSAIHGATRWLMFRWGQSLQEKEVPYCDGREWYTIKIDKTPSNEAPARNDVTAQPPFLLTFVVFQPGDYLIGEFEDPLATDYPHTVRISRPFAILDREIMRAEFETSQLHQPISRFPGTGYHRQVSPSADYPMVNTCWYHAVRYCRWLTEQRPELSQAYLARETLNPPLHPPDEVGWAMDFPLYWPVELQESGFRLPTEAEWEIGCRAGTRSPYSFGSDEDAMREYYAWVNPLGAKRVSDISASVVRSLRPNLRGLFDMHGNVREWCHDFYDGYCNDDADDPVGPSEAWEHVVRSGGWNLGVLPSSRRKRLGGGWSIDLGFRIAQTLPPTAGDEP